MQAVREDFEVLKDWTYLDSATCTLVPQPVIGRMAEYYKRYSGGIRKGAHSLAVDTTSEVGEVRASLADFISAEYGEVIFTSSATHSINTVAFGLDWEKGDRVLLTEAEHNSNIVPWLRAAQVYGIEVDFLNVGLDGTIDLGELEEKVTEKTKLISLSHVSNLYGTLNPVREVARAVDCMVMVDATLSAGHIPLNVRRLECDFMAFSGNIGMMGPTGVGILFARAGLLEGLNPLIYGSGAVYSVKEDRFSILKEVEKFEAGTPNISGIFGLGEAVRYLRRVGLDAIEKTNKRLTGQTLEGLADIDGIYKFGGGSDQRASLVSFNLDFLDSHDIAIILDERAIAVRSGELCSHLLMNKLGVDGAVQVSFHCYNARDDVRKLLELMDELSRDFS